MLHARALAPRAALLLPAAPDTDSEECQRALLPDKQPHPVARRRARIALSAIYARISRGPGVNSDFWIGSSRPSPILH